ncbi:piggyBac transposable element-derived protein 2-like [Anthonomus grandis grandis]|uniref:piggyBac transposable element-derived protein 2-like n=1 Tax=Anthonomus grandis grandis TaxID=2921223 RepID=UPI0021669016|nr:piggyBac transposable element-derived protein 2-like [Anthonomus grandis grandis]
MRRAELKIREVAEKDKSRLNNTRIMVSDSLKEKCFRATGTIRENRSPKCPTKSSKELEKEPRGAYDWHFDSSQKILVVKWNDSRCVSVATNFDTLLPTTIVQRWNKEEGGRVPVAQPLLIAKGNKHMGGVDHHD